MPQGRMKFMRARYCALFASVSLLLEFAAFAFGQAPAEPDVARSKLVVRARSKYHKMDAHFKIVKGAPYTLTRQTDSDGDGLDDASEYAALTNPFEADSDGDGLNDATDPEPLVAKGAGSLPGARVEMVGGTPNFVVAGKPQPLTAFNDGGVVYKPVLQQMGECGMRLYLIKWRTPEPGDREGAYRDLERDLARMVSAVPDCYVIIRLLTRESRWFARTFPSDLQCYSDGTSKWLRESYGSPYLHSWASDAWTAATAGEIVRAINRLRCSRYCRHLAGIQVCAGNTYEWWYYNYPGKSWDYGPAFQMAFRKWAERKYRTIDRLNRAWRTDLAGFGAIELPRPSEKHALNQYQYLDPETQRKVVDYWQCFHEALTDDAIYFTRAVKAASGGRLLAGLEMEGACMAAIQNGKYLTKILQRTPSVDFRSAPSVYLNRAPGGCGPLRIESASMVLAGKVWFNENDFRTHMTATRNVYYNEGNDSAVKSAAVLERLFGQLLITGGHGYWSENEFGNFADPLIHDVFRRAQRASYTALGLDRNSVAEIALVYDEETALIRDWNHHHSHDLLRYSALARTGAPYDFLELDDLLAMERIPYKLCIFAGTGCLDAKERDSIRRKIARDGRVLVWFGVPGLVNPDLSPTTSEDYASNLVGMKLRWHGFTQDPIRLTEEGQGILKTGEDFVFDATRPEIPGKQHRYDKYKKYIYYNFFEALDPDVKLGLFKKGGCGFGLKRMAVHTSVYVSASNMSEEVLRCLARLAGVHIYGDSGDVFFADSRLIMIHTRSPGRKRFALRREAFVWDLLAEKEVAAGVSAFGVDMPAFATRLYFAGARAELDKARRDAQLRLDGEIAERRKARLALAKAESASVGPPPIETPLDADGFVRRYLVIGPFLDDRERFNAIADRGKRRQLAKEWVLGNDFLAQLGGETAIRPKAEMNTPDGKHRWRACNDLGRYVRGTDVGNLDAGIHAFYAAVYLWTEKAIEIQLRTAFDDAGLVWVNATRSEVLDGHRLDSRSFRVRAKAGWNRVLAKVYNRGGATGLALRVTDAAGKPLAGAKVSLVPPENR